MVVPTTWFMVISIMTARISIGTAGWSYPDWIGTVYPRHTRGRFDPLEYLSSYFNLVEINSTFYRLPSRTTCKSWTERASGNPDFLFTVKAHRDMTHSKQALDPNAVSAFQKALDPVFESGKLGFVLLQFPWSFKYTQPARHRIRSLAGSLNPFPLALEVRHGTWADREALSFVGELGLALCGIDQPQIGNSLTPKTFLASSNGAYFRLHGRNAREWFNPKTNRDLRYDYLYSDGELNTWVSRIKETIENDIGVFAVLNNHFRGQAAVNALELKAMLLNDKVAIPEVLLKAYPRLESIVCADEKIKSGHPDDIQGSLFDENESNQQNK
jgi:uncharacterized protein YecE (DUF72 family)